MTERTRTIVALAVALAAASVPLSAQSIAVNAGSTSRINVLPGSAVTVPVIIDLTNAGGASIASLASAVGWNASALTFQSIAVAPALGWTFTPDVSNAAAGSVVFSGSNATALPSTATVANVTFSASGTPSGTRVWLAPSAAADAAAQSILGILQPRALDVCVALSGKWGDANGDATVNIIDAQQIARFSVGLSVANANALSQLSDVTNSGTVDIIDAQQVARYSVGLASAARVNTDPFVQPIVASATVGGGQNVLVGGTLQLFGTPRDAGNADLTGCSSFTWGTSDAAVATVSAGGVVTGVANGTATITATSTTSPGVTAAIIVTVGSPVIRVTLTDVGRPARMYAASVNGGAIPAGTYLGFTLTGAAMNGGTMDLVVPGAGAYVVRVIAFDDASQGPFVSAGGQANVTVGASAALVPQTITLIAPTYTPSVPTQVLANASIPVSWSVFDPSGLIDDQSLSGSCGSLHWSTATPTTDFLGTQLIAGTPPTGCTPLHPATGTLAFNWALPAPSGAATVFMQMWTGQTVLVGSQPTFVIYMSPAIFRNEALLTVPVVKVATVTISPSAPSVLVGGTVQLDATPADAGGTSLFNIPITWQSNATSVATVSGTGIVVGVSAGTATISATIGGVTQTTTVTVTTPAVASVTVTPASPTVPIGASQQMTATPRDASNAVITGLPVSWQSATTSAATISGSGVVHGVGGGSSVITATIGGVSGTSTVTVPPTLAVTTISVSLPASTLSGNATTQATATVRDQFGNAMAGVPVTWSSANPMIAGVSQSGLVHALGTGTSQITVTTGSVTGSATLTVTQLPQQYDIDVQYVTQLGANDPIRTAVSNAAARWRRVIRGDVPDMTYSNVDLSTVCPFSQPAGSTILNGTIDDVVMYVRVGSVDGAGGLLAYAGICYVRAITAIPVAGFIVVDAADTATMRANGTLTSVITHEMGHVIGIGTLWNALGLLQNPAPASSDPTFSGANAQWAFRNLGNNYGGAIVPVENCCGSATRNLHWRESVLARELMTGFITAGAGANPLSPLTAASLIDLGYTVDLSQSDAQPWFLRTGPPTPADMIELREAVFLPSNLAQQIRGGGPSVPRRAPVPAPGSPIAHPPKSGPNTGTRR